MCLFTAMKVLDGDDVRLSSKGRYAERDIVQVGCVSVVKRCWDKEQTWFAGLGLAACPHWLETDVLTRDLAWRLPETWMYWHETGLRFETYQRLDCTDVRLGLRLETYQRLDYTDMRLGLRLETYWRLVSTALRHSPRHETCPYCLEVLPKT